MEPSLPDAPAREAIRTDLDHTLIVEAAAGTGKTTELVNRIVAVLTRGLARVDQVVAVTFTEKAAGELKLRLRSALEEARHEHEALLEDAIARLEEAHISTIHSFCADLLRERPVEARVDPQFEVLTDSKSEQLFSDAFRVWMQEQLAEPPEGIRRFLRRSLWFAGPESGDEGHIERLRRAAWDLKEFRDYTAPWRREAFTRHALIDELIAHIRRLADLTRDPASPHDPLFTGTRVMRQFIDEVDRARAAVIVDYDGWEAALIAIRRDRSFKECKKGRGTFYKPDVARIDVDELRVRLASALEDFEHAANADLAALLHAELRSSLDRYERLKARGGLLDFVDLLIGARELVRGDDTVRRSFQERFTHLFVDEFQDTDPLQAELMLLLASDDPTERDWRRVRPIPGKLFVVGDPKQSIYRFRRADVGTYQQVCELLIARGGKAVKLSTSFRAVRDIQRFVNAAFEPLMQGDRVALQASYVPLKPFRLEESDQPAVVALPVPKPYGTYGRVWGKAIEDSLPDAVAAMVDWLITRSGWRVTERYTPDAPGSTDSSARDRRVPIAARHIAILFRRFTSWQRDVTRPYVDALEARGVAHLLVGGKAFHDREEVETIRAALAAIEWPDDELSVFATLHGALFAIGDEELLEYRHRFKRFHPFQVPADLPARLSAIGECLTLLRTLHTRRNRRPVADTITELIDATRAHVGFVLQPSGEQVLANVLYIAELARQYELGGGISFRGFVDELDEAAQRSQAPEAPILEEGSDGVRLMTVHKAKGLEFPIVILADMTARLTPREASRHMDAGRGLCVFRLAGCAPLDLLDHQAEELAREEAEAQRVAYVAATRARDLLVVPAIGDASEAYTSGWISALNRAIYPRPDRRRDPLPAPACPSFGKDSVLERVDNHLVDLDNVAPGLHVFEPSAGHAQYSVVWWDPRALDLDKEAREGLRGEDLISKDVDSRVVDKGVLEFRHWRSRRDEAIERASTPAIVVRTAVEWADRHGVIEDESIRAADVAVIELARDAKRPSGTRFGTLVHAILSTVPLDAASDTVADVSRVQGRSVAASPDEIASAAQIVGTVLGHPLLVRARAAETAGRCRRETPVTYRDQSGEIIEGVVDLAFDDGEGWTVVDFKTDRELDTEQERYRAQVALYARAVERATGQTATAVLLKI